MEAITCNCCYSIIHKPLHQCCNGHVLPCAGCTKKMKAHECPQCKERFDVLKPVRCLFIEQMAEGLSFPCVECSKNFPYCDLTAHTMDCAGKAVLCSIADCKHESVLWNEALDHLRQAHKLHGPVTRVLMPAQKIMQGSAFVGKSYVFESGNVDGSRIYFLRQYKNGPAARFTLRITQYPTPVTTFLTTTVQAVGAGVALTDIYSTGEYLLVNEHQLAAWSKGVTQPLHDCDYYDGDYYNLTMHIEAEGNADGVVEIGNNYLAFSDSDVDSEEEEATRPLGFELAEGEEGDY